MLGSALQIGNWEAKLTSQKGVKWQKNTPAW